MAKLQKDFLGPFVECNGQINRPMTTTHLTCEKIIKVSHVADTPCVRVIFEDKSEDEWKNCGFVTAYKQAKKIFTENEFKDYVLMSASFSVMDSGAIAQKAYPDVANIWSTGHVQYGTEKVRKHLDLEKSLSDLFYQTSNKKKSSIKPKK